MKWYFAVNQPSLDNDRAYWERLIRVAVRSARQHTDLEPHVLYDGAGDSFIDELAGQGVIVVRHKVSFFDALLRHNPDPVYERIAGGAFLRTELPLINTEDEYVVYTDCDVLFLDRLLDIPEPEYFACAPEFNIDDFVNLNTGVMVMNLPKLRESFDGFRNYIVNNLGNFVAFDQCAYKQFYPGRNTKLPLDLNWRAYWGIRGTASIVHFHGPKPDWIDNLRTGPDDGSLIRQMISWNPEGYDHYLSLWRRVEAA